ncbi:MAG: hypothetical protein A2509_00945 [Candidatus Edwardsbacteria bacterium RIFOXYD12_FULL_50_11]|jgi:hypothetical protein|uniref:Lipoprotein n=1 Tax=Candidatus Edwardsbacteria bacterium GWF2_54_11 TaxID=1817851 RepID=A0A1F5RCC1_9BACT|nr:MAG: hypothetical protein A2502_07530 [Candidatus Edwardsbacteria bacterium RifOxyC12_full_54_24]OGF07551.1 MAG: hypothetical protein A2273_03530 [Candidatus Edwardsbacteria bacterium RifOxyA12_full_54_48]OGF09801.1 MAG: hypothetical protein A3K15_09940 [Candidatus Edwardsbacteria bacterium GWE2_54_12]OGF12064.1 MAG: hypothetical protein A2024_03495 [Candidatus Edwardsbacteria bacterium GWF2_54_11]OGF16162.1 MAG: hypothetical protein A2509_00945 [Candidatus Edwardsbacteria bacterium RIFOXYD1
MLKHQKYLLAAILFVGLATLAGCIPGDGHNTVQRPAGFFWGIWHGWVAPISLIMSIFKKNIRLYEVFNNGWLYDFGFYIAVISGFGGLSLFRRKKTTCK